MKWYLTLCWLPLLYPLDARAGAASPIHPIHVSKFTMKYSPADTGYRATLYLFVDDLAEAINGMPGAVPSHEEVDLSVADSLIDRYVRQHLHVQVDYKEIIPVWVGKELSDNRHAYWVYMFYPAEKPGVIQVEDTIFTGVSDEQKNIVQYYDAGGKLHEEVLNKDRIRIIFNP